MKGKSRMRLISYIAAVAMLISVFNIPLTGYAVEQSDSEYGIFIDDDGMTEVTDTYEVNIATSLGDPVDYFYVLDKNKDYENYEAYDADYVAEWTSSNPEVAKCIYAETANEEVRIEYLSKGTTTISAEIEGSVVASFDMKISDIGIEYATIEEPESEDYSYLLDSENMEIEVGTAVAVHAFSGSAVFGENIIIEADFSVADTSIASQSTDEDGNVIITGLKEGNTTITAVDKNDATNSVTYDLYVNEKTDESSTDEGEEGNVGDDESEYDESEIEGPATEVKYYVGDEEKVKTIYYDEDNDTNWINIPYTYDREKGISVTVTHTDGTTTEAEITWSEVNNDYGYVTFEDNGSSYILEVDIASGPCEDTGCQIYLKTYDDNGDSFSIYVDDENIDNAIRDVTSEEGLTVIVPYGYNRRVELYAEPYSDEAQLKNFYKEDEEESGYVLVSDGETRTFDVVAENGDTESYKITVEYSDGKSADIDMMAEFYYNKKDEFEQRVPVDFTEDRNGNKYAEVILPYMYDDNDGEGISLYEVPKYCGYTLWDVVFMGDDDEKTVEFDVTSPDGTVTKSYTIKFMKETAEAARNTELETFILSYVDENGDMQAVDIDPADAADEDGAAVVIPETALVNGNDISDIDIQICAKLAGYSYVDRDNVEENGIYFGDWGQNKATFWCNMETLSYRASATVTFDVTASNGTDTKSYRLKVINGARINDATIDGVEISYTYVGEEEATYADISLDEDNNTGEITLYPYDASKPIVISGTGADGSKICKLVQFEEGEDEVTVTFASQSADGKNKITYTVTVYAPKSVVKVNYEDDGELWYIEDLFSDDCECTIYIPYTYDTEKGISIDVILPDGTGLAPSIVWDSKTREDEHDSLTGKAQFTEGGRNYTINIVVEGVSSDKGVVMWLYDTLNDEEIYIDSDKASTAEGTNVTIPRGHEEGDLCISIVPDNIYATVDGYRGGLDEPVKAGETKVYTVTAQDGTTQEYKVTFIAEAEEDTHVCTWDEGKITTKPTCTEKGVKTYRCTSEKCDKTKTEEVAPLGHTEVIDKAVDATCTETGLTEGNHCSVCNKVLIAQKETAALGHTEVIDKEVAATYASTGLTEGKHCGVCGEVLTAQKEIPVLVYSGKSSKATADLSTAKSGYDNVKVSWNKVAGAAGYVIKYKKSSESKWSSATVKNTTSYTTGNLTAGVKYEFRVYPYITDSGKNYVSNQYTSGSVYTLKKISTPKVKRSGNKVKVSWTNINGESGYQISKSTKKSGTSVVATYKTTTGKSKTITAKKGKKYYYKVRAYKNVKVGSKIYKVYGPWSNVKAYKR